METTMQWATVSRNNQPLSPKATLQERHRSIPNEMSPSLTKSRNAQIVDAMQDMLPNQDDVDRIIMRMRNVTIRSP